MALGHDGWSDQLTAPMQGGRRGAEQVRRIIVRGTRHITLDPEILMSTTPAVSYGPTAPRPVTPVTIRQPGPQPRARSYPTVLRVVRWVDPIADIHGVHPCSRSSSCTGCRSLALAPPGSSADSPTASSPTRAGWRSTSSKRLAPLASVSGWARTLPSDVPCSASVPSNWPGPTDPRPWPYAPVSRPCPFGTSAGSPNRSRPATVGGWPNSSYPSPSRCGAGTGGWPTNLVAAGYGQAEIERQLAHWHFHPTVAFSAAHQAVGLDPAQPGSSSCPAGVSPQ